MQNATTYILKDSTPQIFDVQETADILRTNRQVIMNLINNGLLGSIKLGAKHLITKEALEVFLRTYQGADLSNVLCMLSARNERGNC